MNMVMRHKTPQRKRGMLMVQYAWNKGVFERKLGEFGFSYNVLNTEKRIGRDIIRSKLVCGEVKGTLKIFQLNSPI